jgi:hypothetical protein
MSNNAVGLEQVGGVTQAAKGMVDNADSRGQAARALKLASDATGGRMVGPAGNLQRAAMDTHASAAGFAGLNGATVANSFAHAEKTVVQGVEDSAQEQRTSTTDAEATHSVLSKPIEA